MKILNLYAGLGGNRKSWTDIFRGWLENKITAVEIDKKIAAIYRKRFPEDQVVIADVMQFVREEDLDDYDFIWASPPCQTHSCATSKNKRSVPDLTSIYGLMIFLDYQCNTPYVIENVQPWYKVPLFWRPNFKLDRHLFWANFTIPVPKKKIVDSSLSHDMTLHKRDRSIIMRGGLFDLLEYQDFDPALLKGFENKEILLRNMTHWKIGEYILKCLENQKNLDSFI